MIDISGIVRDWPVLDGWSISPGVPWCAEGNRIKVGVGARIGYVARIGNGASIGDGARIGDRARIGGWAFVGYEATIGYGARIGDRATIGAEASIGDRTGVGYEASIGGRARIGNGTSIGERARIGDEASIGPNARIPDNTTFARDLGVQSGYRHLLVIHEDAVKITGGRHVFTLDEAHAYWSDKPDRVEALAAVDFAEALAKLIPETARLIGERDGH